MFGFGKKLRKDLPAIDISKKKEKGFFGREKIVPRSKMILSISLYTFSSRNLSSYLS